MTTSDLREAGRAMRRKLAGDAIVDRLEKEVYSDPHMQKFAEITQDVLFAQLWQRPGLDLKTKTMITLIVDVATGSTGSTDALGPHVRYCRNHGWSEDEIVEAILHCLGYIGAPLVRKALIVTCQVFREMRENGEAS